MGTDKALVHLEGKPLVARVARRLQGISDDVFIVCKQQLEIDIPVVLDDIADQTPLAGIITALRAARHPLVFVCACDMPFVDVGVVRAIASQIGGRSAAVASHGGSIEPLHAVWSVGCLPGLEQLWRSGERSVHGVLQRLDALIVDVDEDRSFTNVNTPDDLIALSAPNEPLPSS